MSYILDLVEWSMICVKPLFSWFSLFSNEAFAIHLDSDHT